MELRTKENIRGVTLTVGVLVLIASIVFLSLVAVTLFIAALPKVLGLLHNIWPEAEERHATVSAAPQVAVSEDDAIFAAIGFAFHHRQQESKPRN